MIIDNYTYFDGSKIRRIYPCTLIVVYPTTDPSAAAAPIPGGAPMAAPPPGSAPMAGLSYHIYHTHISNKH